MLHACVVRFDVTENVKILQNMLGTKQGLRILKLYICMLSEPSARTKKKMFICAPFTCLE